MAIATINPTTGETLKTFDPLTDAEIEAKLELAQQAFNKYRHLPFEQRALWMQKAADILERDREIYAKMMTLEMGKTLKSAIAEIEKCALVCRYYAKNAAQFMADAPVTTDASNSFVRYQPLGAILDSKFEFL